MNIIDKNIDHYKKAFSAHFNGQKKQTFQHTREKAREAFSKLGFPTTRQEEWRFTNVSEIAKSGFNIAKKGNIKPIDSHQLDQYKLDESHINLVFIDGFFSEQHSNMVLQENGLKVSALSHLLNENDPALLKYLSSLARYESEIFTALNTAFTDEGSVIQIADKAIIEKEIHIINVASQENCVSFPRNIIILGKNSNVTVIESVYTLGEFKAFINSVSEIYVGDNAHLAHYRLQNISKRAYQINNSFVIQGAHSNYLSVSMDFGGKIIRNNLSTQLNGEGIISTLNGLYIGQDDQHIDNHTFIDHAKPHCESHELYRGILHDKSKGVFSGKILVRQEAQKTDAKQSNNCLLMSDDAQIDSKPQLEIYADDVKCTHGATIGQLDDSAIFYLRARGIPEKKAYSMLIYSFAEEIVESIKTASLRERMDKIILNRLEGTI